MLEVLLKVTLSQTDMVLPRSAFGLYGLWKEHAGEHRKSRGGPPRIISGCEAQGQTQPEAAWSCSGLCLTVEKTCQRTEEKA